MTLRLLLILGWAAAALAQQPPPPLTITTPSTLPEGTAGQPYSAALQASGGVPPYVWSVNQLPPGLSLNANNGVIAGTPTTAGNFGFGATVADAAQRTFSGAFDLRIHPALVITTTSLPEGVVGGNYAATLAATGGKPPYRWAVLGGALPPGLRLDSDAGTISGTPTVLGDFSFIIQLSDSNDTSASRPLSITIRPGGVTITTTSPLPEGTTGVLYSRTLTAVGGATPYTWSIAAGALPGSLTLAPASGVISGIPTAAGTFSFTARVTDATGASPTRAFTLTILRGPLAIITASPLPQGSVGTPYSQRFDAAGGSPPYTWGTGAGGLLPSGMTLNVNTGVMSGTPVDAATFNFTIRVIDATQAVADKPFTLVIAAAPPVITSPSPLPGGVVGTAYSQSLAASGGVPPYDWSITGGALPAGLSLSAAGAISGTPTAAGTSSFTARVTDRNGAAATRSFEITIAAALAITTTSLPSGVAGTAYSSSLVATGGIPPLAWSIAAGALPGGLTLNTSSGVLSGTPSAAGSFTFTARVADSAGTTAVRSFTITITAALAITTASCPNATVEIAYSCALAAAGGTTPLAWSISAGALPAGLLLNSASGVISGTPTAVGTSNFTVLVTDAVRATASRGLSILVDRPAISSFNLRILAGVVGPAQQPALAVALAADAPLRLTGRLQVAFASDALVPADDSNIQFFDPVTRAPLGRVVTFAIEAGSTQAIFGTAATSIPFQSGTVSGMITFTIIELRAGATDLTPVPNPALSIPIRRLAPVITSVTIGARAATSFQLLVNAYATSRSVQRITVTLSPSGTGNFQATTITLDLAAIFRAWFESVVSRAFGSQFRLTIPFTIQNGEISAIRTISVTLANEEGTSAAVEVVP